MKTRRHTTKRESLIALGVLLLVALSPAVCRPAVYRTENFVVEADSAEVARGVAERSEFCRREHARIWLGRELPNWRVKCQVQVKIQNNSGGGATSYNPTGEPSFQFSGTWVGRYESLIADVVPHEVLHTVLATHIRTRIPRWADEGLCTFVETPTARRFQRSLGFKSLTTGRGIPIDRLMAAKEYPQNSSDMLAFYAQGYLLTEYMISISSRREFLNYIIAAIRSGGDWPKVTRAYYGVTLLQLQNNWLDWMKAGAKLDRHLVMQFPNCPPGGT